MAQMKVETPKKSGKRKVERFRVHKASNGYTTHQELESPKSPGAHVMMGMQSDPKPAVFNDKKSLMEHLSGLVDQMGGDESGAPAPGASAMGSTDSGGANA